MVDGYRGAILALATTSVLGFATFYAYGRRVRGGDRTRATARLRRMLRIGLPTVYLLALVGMVGAGWLDALDQVGGGPWGGTLVGPLTAVAGLGAPTVAVVAAYLGAFPAISDLRETEMSAARAALRLLRYVLGLVVLFVAVLLGANAVGDAAGLAVAVTLVLVALVGASPWLVRLLQPTRSPTATERERLDGLTEAAGLDVRGVVVLETADARTAGAVVRGVPGLRYLLVSDHLLDVADDRRLRAYLALQAGRVRTGHLPIRLAIALVTVVGPAGVLLGLWSLPGVGDGIVAVALFLGGVAGLWIGRRLVYRADEYAAGRTDPEAVVAALRLYADANDAPTEWGRRRTITAMEPPIADRIDRLRADERD